MQPPRRSPKVVPATEASLRRMYIEGHIEIEEFEYAIEKVLRSPRRRRPIPPDTGQPETRG